MRTWKDLPTSIPRDSPKKPCLAVTDDGTEYLLGPVIGEGAAGVIFEGYRLINRRYTEGQYAIKVLLPLKHIACSESRHDRMVRRFTAEAKRAKHLDHPHLCKIIDRGELLSEEDDWHALPQYVMAYVNGKSLASLMNDVPPPALLTRLKWICELG
jgi:serine/threonine protein kinase